MAVLVKSHMHKSEATTAFKRQLLKLAERWDVAWVQWIVWMFFNFPSDSEVLFYQQHTLPTLETARTCLFV